MESANKVYRPKNQNPEDSKESHSPGKGKESAGKGKGARGDKKGDGKKEAAPVKLFKVELSSFKTHK